METICLKTTIYSRRELLTSVLPAMPHVTWYQRPRVINLLQSSSSSQLGKPRESCKVKMVSQCDFLIWKNLCTISIAARTSCVIATPGKGQLLSRKNGGKNWPTPPFNGQRHQQRIRSVSSCPLMSVTKSGPCWKYELTTLADYRISVKRWWIYVDDEMNRKDFEVDAGQYS